MSQAVPAVFLGQSRGGDIRLGHRLSLFDAELLRRLRPVGGTGGAQTLMYPSDNSSGGTGGGFVTLAYPHD